ncbi:MAG: hypothetical protein WCR33_05160 [Bacilli bacterium]
MINTFQRLSILTRMQVNAILRKKNKNSKYRRLVQWIVKILIAVIASAAFYGVFLVLKFFSINVVDKNLLGFVILFIQLISIISCTAGLVDALYYSADNPILLSFPARHYEIFISKLLVYYVKEFYRNLYFLIPFLVSYGIYNSIRWSYYLFIFLFIIILPLIPVIIGALLSLPIMLMKKFSKDRNFVQGIIIILLFGVLLYFYPKLLALVPNPLKIFSNYYDFVVGVRNFLLSITNHSLFYLWIVNILVGIKTGINMLKLTGLVLGLLLIVFLSIMPTYFKLASHGLEFSARKIKAGKQNKVIKSTYLTFLKKEILVNFRNLGKLVNDYIYLFIFPFIMFFLCHVFSNMNIDSFGNKIIIVSITAIGLMLTTASNTSSASAITTEGYEFTLLKTAPSDTRKIAWAKLTFNLAISIFIISMNMILLLIFSDLKDSYLLLIWVVLVLLNSAHIFWSFDIDLMNPKLVDYATNGHITDTKNLDKSVTIGFVLSMLTGIIMMLLLLDDYTTGWIRIIIIVLVVFVFRLVLLSKRLKAYFLDIEY